MKKTRGRKSWETFSLILTFFSNYIYYLYDAYLFICFCYGFPLKGMRANNSFLEDFCSLIETAESDSTVSMRHRDGFPWFLMKQLDQFLWSQWDSWIWSWGFNDTAESVSAVLWRLRNLFSKILSRLSRQIPSHMQNGFSPWIRGIEGIVWWKTEGRKSRDTA
jgi:hypothetical protein